MNYLNINKQAWNNRTKIHMKSKFYDVESFKKGKSSLNKIELDQVGDVKDKSLLHLQCHFGQDTLSWARLGAKVTGVDLSSEAIKEANLLKESLGLEATFIESDVCAFGKDNKQQFDIVFTSYGVLSWLENLDDWAKTIANSLKAKAEFHMVEFHTFSDILSGYSYFPNNKPDIEEEGTYTENCDGSMSTIATWSHSISEVITALINAGLTIETFCEYAYSPYNCFENLEFVPNLGYQMLYEGQQVPLLYSIKARKLS
ncbi:SAM-dependent methyltransferase [Malaciobacter molluscorum LMG 25693]|uniref:SAM-dependent methyltransferase n=1 Tax=Malaciobacter molluscorum LMG 25693 TaxID=870501 RepID=A0A2G1DLJ9_9BACT|nr:class I SAM-dependent methyltransferase [Malaciobacter molluscorum]AXX92154.1 SAM-dependent methyltransferase [Malaciobacter molluscorum LMG 25693]PHO19383.1 SAM-dependent methyltransferase [Malaciobacter molluscorum LMG 25693]